MRRSDPCCIGCDPTRPTSNGMGIHAVLVAGVTAVAVAAVLAAVRVAVWIARSVSTFVAGTFGMIADVAGGVWDVVATVTPYFLVAQVGAWVGIRLARWRMRRRPRPVLSAPLALPPGPPRRRDLDEISGLIERGVS